MEIDTYDSKRKVFFLKNELFRRKAFLEYKRSLENEMLSNKKLQELNFQKRVKLLKFVYNNISFYKNFYDSYNLNPKNFKEKEYWKEIPILKKADIRDNFDEIRNPSYNARDTIKASTSGSTGKPLKFYRDKKFPEEIIKWRMLKRWGIHPGVDVAQFWRIPAKKTKFFNKLINKIIWWPTNRLSFDASYLSDSKMLEITNKINSYKPELFWGYVGALEQYALFLEKNKIELNYKPKCVWVTAAPLTSVQIEIFEKKFTDKIINQYACSEIHWVASSVPDSENLLLDFDYRHVDIVNENGDSLGLNKTGDILITDLHNYAFPLIKYQVGDRSKFVNETSSIAPAFPMMAPIKGRKSDKIETKTGIILSGEFLTAIFNDYTEEIRQFQIRQVDQVNVEILIVLRVEEQKAKRIFNKVNQELVFKSNHELNFHFKIVDEIVSDRGKTRYIVNELSA